MVRIEALVHHWPDLPGRAPAERAALGRAFIAKAVVNLSATRMLINRLCVDPVLRRLCGWSRLSEVPHEATGTPRNLIKLSAPTNERYDKSSFASNY